MSIRIAINHNTSYQYDRPVHLSPHVFRLRPAVHSRTAIESYSFRVTPDNHFINWQQDPFGNFQARVVFPEKTTELKIMVEIIATMVVINPFDFFVESYAEKFPFAYKSDLLRELAPYLEVKENGVLLQSFASQLPVKDNLPIVDFLVAVNQKVNKAIEYTIRLEAGVQTAEETLLKALGSCRDSAWLMVQLFRQIGIAARFVSGYLVQLTADVKSLDGPSGPAADFTDLHAWVEVYIPGAGWVGLDATSGLFAGEGHIPLCCTPDYASAAPVSGATDVCKTTFVFDNKVTRLQEDPRVTKPYTAAQWEAIEALGFLVDEDLQHGDVRLTMGGEPTFVSIDDMESAQWNTAADGSHKRALAHDLVFRLRHAFGPGGMLHYGMGKWYPGEPLPRWQYGLFWRKDGLPVWRNEQWLAHEKTEKKYTTADAFAFSEELARHLGVTPKHISEAYEDAFYFLWTEGKIPDNVDPYKFNLKDGLERQTLSQLLQQGLDSPAGYVLPIQWNYMKQHWESAPWVFHSKRLLLLPGNSPIGFRLPLNSLPTTVYREEKVERDPFETLPHLVDTHLAIIPRYGETNDYIPPVPIVYKEALIDNSTAVDFTGLPKKRTEPLPEQTKNIDNILKEVPTIRTAISVEERDGFIYVFFPPVDYLEHYLDLVASVEATAAKLAIPVRIEGYEPPRDYRLERLVVSPDPGVIEVNIHPSKTWQQLLENTNTLYEQALLSRLGTQKFMLDGKHSGTGGGNHITLGGITPADSPLLRRPDLLRSFITYWQHHPGLSYLFSGSFIGPTSQAPRIDEGLEDRLYEMEIAFSQIPEDGFVPFWLTDRLFRHLLTDITGNTHRSEFCIDKMYSPDSASGRLGILEFRAFDMPPHQQMSLVQMLLIRALVAWFWKVPYKHNLVRWGTQLNDKYMLPHYVQQDMQDVVDDLNRAGYPFQMSWFDPFFEFRFPHYGTVQVQGVQMEIRMGIEPWHVLGEEMSSSGTARFVDSSLERLQVRLENMNGDRYVLLCNGNRVPLQATNVQGEFIGGIRYRAWQPPSALHPTIGVDTPLVFDLVDTWNGRSVGGCTYYVSHPGGRGYNTFPVNSYEAESRRVSRFGNTNHTQDVLRPEPGFASLLRFVEPRNQIMLVDAPAVIPNPEFPVTLDLRKTKRVNKR